MPKPFKNEADQAVGPILWGLWISPVVQHAIGLIVDAPVPTSMPVLAPLAPWVWSTVAINLGLYRFAAAYWLDLNHREHAATLCSVLWLTLAVLFLIRLPYAPATVVYLGAAYQSLASMGRIRMLR